MKKFLKQKFIKLFFAVFFAAAVILYFTVRHILADNTAANMLYTLKLIDGAFDYDGSGEPSRLLENIGESSGQEASQLTIISGSGEVIIGGKNDRETQKSLDSKELKEALEKGEGYSIRSSETTGESMIYAALRSEREGEDIILRLGSPYTPFSDCIGIIIPALLLSLSGGFLFSCVITERFAEESTRPLREIKDRLLHEKRVRQEFFANASHELKTPITSIRGYAELLESNMVEDEEMKRDIITRIKKESERMSELIGDILEVSRLEADEEKSEMMDVDMSKLSGECVNSFRTQAEKNDITLYEDIEKDVHIRADLSHMTELLENLISNAIRYNKPSGSAGLRLYSENGEVIIKVKDTGIGIPEGEREKIFNRFYRVDKGRSRMLGGTGLGLAIVKHVVEYYGGSISVESEQGRGSEFTVRLPVKRPAEKSNF